MIQRREELRFPFEPREAFLILREPLGKDLDGDVAIQLGVTSPIDLTHASRAHEARDLIRTKFGSGSDCHGN